MIPRVEDALISGLERRIAAAMPETAPGIEATPETFITVIEGRTVVPNVQEEEDGLTVFCTVTADISVTFYSRKTRCDYSPMLADFCRRPWIDLSPTGAAAGAGAGAKIRVVRSEAVEGPYLSNDAWLFRAEYPVFEVGPGHGWQPPTVANVTAGVHPLFPRPLPDVSNEPAGLFARAKAPER